MGIGNYR